MYACIKTCTTTPAQYTHQTHITATLKCQKICKNLYEKHVLGTSMKHKQLKEITQTIQENHTPFKKASHHKGSIYVGGRM